MPTPPRSSESRRRVSPGSLLSIITSDLSNIMGTRRGPISDEDASLLHRQQAQARRRSSTESRSRTPSRSRSRSPRRSPPTARNKNIRSGSVRRGKNKNTRRRSPPRKNKTPSPDTDGRRQTRRDNRNRSR